MSDLDFASCDIKFHITPECKAFERFTFEYERYAYHIGWRGKARIKIPERLKKLIERLGIPVYCAYYGCTIKEV